jgi:hydroxymethylbilane synthase
LQQRLATLTHRPTWLAVQAERAVSRALGGSCSMPLAAYAHWAGDVLKLDVALGHALTPLAPLRRAQAQAEVTDDTGARALGERAARSLRDAGGAEYLAAALASAAAP